MTVGLLLVTHGRIGAALLDAAERMFGMSPLEVDVVGVEPDADPDLLRRELRGRLDVLDQGDGVLILTDIFGGTPSNVSRSVSDGQRVCMIAGVNLPMLVRLLNYPGLSAAELAVKAIGGGREGIFGSNAATND
jgi:PTS system mannose-specific IIA component